MALRVVNIVGARPNFMKVAPLYSEYRKFPDAIEPILVHTGQHYDAEMSDVFLSQLNIPQPQFYLGVGSGSHADQTAKMMLAFEPIVQKIMPDIVVVVGDVNSTLACSVVAAKLQIPVAHVEAGLRSFDRTMPEEINRIVTDSLSTYLFTHCESANENLRREGIAPERIFFVGNIMIDTLRTFQPHIASSTIRRQLRLDTRPYGYITLHRPSSVDDRTTFRGLLDAFGEIQRSIALVWPVHPRSEKMLDEFHLREELSKNPNLITTKPVSYVDSLHLMTHATFVMTDSGGVQEETTVLGVPCLTLRPNTERPITIEQGTNTLVGLEAEAVIREVKAILAGKRKTGKIPPLWDGKTAERIVLVLLKHRPAA